MYNFPEDGTQVALKEDATDTNGSFDWREGTEGIVIDSTDDAILIKICGYDNYVEVTPEELGVEWIEED